MSDEVLTPCPLCPGANIGRVGCVHALLLVEDFSRFRGMAQKDRDKLISICEAWAKCSSDLNAESRRMGDKEVEFAGEGDDGLRMYVLGQARAFGVVASDMAAMANALKLWLES